MRISRRLSAAIAGAAVCLVSAAPSVAAGPATVTVRVEGAARTLVPLTQVTTTTAPVVNDGNPEHACPGTDAVGALQLATGGNWEGTWFTGLGYSVNSIAGEPHAFGSGAFWDFWLNHSEALTGICEAELESGEEVLFFPCSETAAACPNPLAVEAPASANVGETIPVRVKRFSTSGVSTPQAGATVSFETGHAITDEHGEAKLSLASAGQVTLTVSAPESVRAEGSVCVHSGNDGTCGTSGPSGTPSSNTSGGETSGNETHLARSETRASAQYRGPYALIARVRDPSDDHVYRRGRAPRLLSGTIRSHTTVTSVSLRLRRRFRGRCYAFDGVRAQFIRASCGTASFFKVSRGATFSYLLPAALGPGRYVLDVEAADAAGNHVTLARGTSRLVFYVQR